MLGRGLSFEFESFSMRATSCGCAAEVSWGHMQRGYFSALNRMCVGRCPERGSAYKENRSLGTSLRRKDPGATALLHTGWSPPASGSGSGTLWPLSGQEWGGVCSGTTRRDTGSRGLEREQVWGEGGANGSVWRFLSTTTVVGCKVVCGSLPHLTPKSQSALWILKIPESW